MLETYLRLLSKPGAAAFAFAGLVSRFPIAMFNIGLFLMIEGQYGGAYEMAGRVAGISALAWAAQTVPTARWVDRVGQRVAMYPLAALHLAGVVIAIVAAMNHGPEYWLWVAAVLAAFSGPLGSLTRARWSHILRSDKDLHTAFSLEGALDEVLFIGGPALVTVLATTVWPPLGLIVSSTGFAVGLLILLAQRETEPPAREATAGVGLGFRIPGVVWGAAAIAFAAGAMFGAVDASTIAFADEFGHKDKAGFILGLLALGSFVGGLLYGAREFKTPLRWRLVLTSVAVAVGFSAMAFMPNLLLFGAVGFLAGICIAPMLASMDNAVQRSVKPDQLIEGMSWIRIGLGIGVSGGIWLAGFLIEAYSARAGLAFMGSAAVLIALIALAIVPVLRRGLRDDVREAG